MAPPAYPPTPPGYQEFGMHPDEFPGFHEIPDESEVLFSDDHDHESFEALPIARSPGSLHAVPELSNSPTSSTESLKGSSYPTTRVLYSSAAFQYSYTGRLDIEYFDAVTDNIENSLTLLRNLAVIPRCSLKKERHISKVEATPASWTRLQEYVRSNMFYLLSKLMSRLEVGQLEVFQLDESNSEGLVFPELRKQQRSLRHLSLHDTSLVCHFAAHHIPCHLQSLVVHGIDINLGTQFLSFLTHLSRYHKSLNYLSLDFDDLSFPHNVDWVGLEREFGLIRSISGLKSLTIANCQDMMAFQFSTLAMVPWSRLQRLKIVNCPSTEAGGCPGLIRRLQVLNLTHLNLTRTCSPHDAADILGRLEIGLKRLHLEFNYEQGQIKIQSLLRHSQTLRSLWLESSTGKHFRMVESTADDDLFFKELAQFKQLRELAVAVRYAAIEQYMIDWENPPNIRIFRILNLVDRYIHKTKDQVNCACKVAEDFARIHEDELTKFHSRDLQVIVVGRHIEDVPEVEPVYYFVNTPQSDSSSSSSSTSNPFERKQFERIPTYNIPSLHLGRDRSSDQSGGFEQQAFEYDAGDEAAYIERPRSPGFDDVSHSLFNLNVRDQDDNEKDPSRGDPGLPEGGLRCCTLTNIDEVKSQIREITIIDVDRQGAPFWEQDEMIIEEYYPNPAYF